MCSHPAGDHPNLPRLPVWGSWCLLSAEFCYESTWGRVTWNIGVRRGVSKVVEDGRSPPTLHAATPEPAVRPFQGWPTRKA
jgi:hypothetical protein